ncbi:hypothetical protein EBR57_07020, partial [bacterium]|nr:hypothetical protein [bacterium]
YGLQGMTDSDEARDLMAELTKKIPSILDSQAICNALYGLQGMTNSPKVEALLNALANQFPDTSDFSIQGLGIAIFGLRKFRDSTAVGLILDKLSQVLMEMDDPLSVKSSFQLIQGSQSLMQTEAGREKIKTLFENAKFRLNSQEQDQALRFMLMTWLKTETPIQDSLDLIQCIAKKWGNQESLPSLQPVQILSILRARKIDPSDTHLDDNASAELQELERVASRTDLRTATRAYQIEQPGSVVTNLNPAEIGANIDLLPSVLHKIAHSSLGDLVKVEQLREEVFDRGFGGYSANTETMAIYVPSRFSGSDLDLKKFVGNILITRPKGYEGNLTIVLGYNHPTGTNGDFEALCSDIQRLLADQRLKTTLKNLSLRIIAQEYQWEGIRYPFGLMRTKLLERIHQEEIACSKLTLIAMDGDIRMRKSSWQQIARVQQSPTDSFGGTGFRSSDKANSLTRDAQDLDYQIHQALNDVQRPNETLTYMSGKAARLMLENRVYPVFDNENNHLLRFLRHEGILQFTEKSIDERVELANDDSFRLKTIPIYPALAWPRADAIKYYSTMRSQRQSMAQTRSLGLWLGLVYGVSGQAVSKLIKVFDWKNLIEIGLNPDQVKAYQEQLYAELSKPKTAYYEHYQDKFRGSYPEILERIRATSAATAEFMLEKVGKNFRDPATLRAVSVADYLSIRRELPVAQVSNPYFGGRIGQINQPYGYSPIHCSIEHSEGSDDAMDIAEDVSQHGLASIPKGESLRAFRKRAISPDSDATAPDKNSAVKKPATERSSSPNCQTSNSTSDQDAMDISDRDPNPGYATNFL